ncbi:MAG: SusC/RagA family TonB-linked outer membrane protein [Bacteroidota bacterium]
MIQVYKKTSSIKAGQLIKWRPIACLLLSLGFSQVLLAQQNISGTVYGEDREPLIGASITPQGVDDMGTITDVDGSYSLVVGDEVEALVVTYIGYTERVVRINGRTSIDIRMSEDTEVLNEVVVIAYGEAKATDVIGAVDQVTSREIEGLAVNSFDQALSGQVAGVQVRTGSGRPDGGASILMRGAGTTGDNSPLLVVDGVPYGNYTAHTNNFLSLINPEDIESISVIRDASGKALYGSRAGNGLIIVTTKRGRPGPPTISFSSTVGFESIMPFEEPDNLNATELAQFLRERIEDQAFVDGVDPDIPENLENPSQYGEGTDWWDAVTRTGQRLQTNISVRGGSQNMNYSVSAGYLRHQGVVIETDFRRYTMRATLNGNITPWLKFGAIFNPSLTENFSGDTDPGSGQFQAYHTLQVARWADPTAPLRDENGNLTLTTQGELLPFFQANPVYKLQNQINYRVNRQILSQFNLDAEVLPGLTIGQKVAANLIFNRGRQFSPGSVVGTGLTPNNPDPAANSRASTGRYENLRLLSETTIRYDRNIGRHNIELLAGYVAEYTEETTASLSGNRLIDENFTLFNSGNIATFLENTPEDTRIFFSGNEGITEQALVSYIGRVSYNFDEKYYVTGSIRRDASSRFGPGLQAAIFPALGLAWRVSSEPWFPESKVLSNLRVELSVGETGNNRIGNYAYQGTLGGANYVLGGGQAIGRFVNGLPNNLLGWETVAQTDLSVELGLFQNRLNIEATLYQQLTKDLLIGSAPIPRISGFGGIVSNLGTIENRGIEIQVSAKPIVRDNFVWSVGANFTANRNELTKLGFENTPIFRTNAGNGTQVSWTLVGEPVAQYYGLNILGLYTPEMIEDPNVPKYPGAVAGAPFYEDGDGDGQLEAFEDYVFLGDPYPNFNFGINTFVTWGPVTLRLVGNGEVGGKILDLRREIELNTDGVFNVRREVIDRFRPGSTDYTLRVPTTTSTPSSQRYRWPNSLAVEDGTFFRLSNASLSYKLDDLLNNVRAIKGLTLTFSVQNVFVISSFRGNPEVGRGTGALERNISYSSYPTVRTYQFGVNMNL